MGTDRGIRVVAMITTTFNGNMKIIAPAHFMGTKWQF